jgi:hypothetical protein
MTNFSPIKIRARFLKIEARKNISPVQDRTISIMPKAYHGALEGKAAGSIGVSLF